MSRPVAAVISARGLGNNKHVYYYRGAAAASQGVGVRLDRGTRSAVMFVEKALRALLQDKDIRRSHHAELKAACEALLHDLVGQAAASAGQRDKVKEDGAGSSTEEGAGARGSVLPEVDAAAFPVDMERLFKPFELACQSR